jgi:isocitrate dehydrogenase (NAD+)
MMLDHLDEHEQATRVRAAVQHTVVEDAVRTRDLGGTATTAEFGDAVARRLS